jgi:lysozyme family protein
MTFQANKEQIILGIIEREGGMNSFTDIKDDRGGATRAGITLNTAMAIYGYPITKEELRGWDRRKILQAYELFLEGHGHKEIYEMLDNDLHILFADTVVNCGHKRAVKLMQKSINKSTKYVDAFTPLVVDGIMGEKTKRAYALFVGRRQEGQTFNKFIGRFKRIYIDQRMIFYIRLCEADASQIKFLEGWYNRCIYMRFAKVK